MQVRWNGVLSGEFPVSNGVSSPILFTIYIDDLLVALQNLGVCCHWKGLLVGAVCYADDIVLIVPSASALRIMLWLCEGFATSHGLKFNSSKTQLIHFGLSKYSSCTASFWFCGASLFYSDSVTHLGHVLKYDLNDDDDATLKAQQIIRQANCVFHTFRGIDPAVLSRLFHSYCMSLYGCAVWNLACKGIRTVEVALNNILRRIWKLPAWSHTTIVHVVAGIQSVYNLPEVFMSHVLSSRLSFTNCSWCVL